MKKLLIFTLFTTLSISLLSCAKPSKIKSFASVTEMVSFAESQIESISIGEFKNLKLNTEDYLFDIRTAKEVLKGSIPKSIHIPRGQLEFRISFPKQWKKVKTLRSIPDKNSKIYIYCASGTRGALATFSLQQIGFKNVINLIGGYNGYRDL